MPSFPDNFSRLHIGEEYIRSKAIDAIASEAGLNAHADIIERTMDLLDFFIRQHIARDADEETIQLLGIRFFNALASAFKLLLSGYYQASAMLQRDILETVFLVDMFRTERTRISKWRDADDRTRKTDFLPIKVRTFLDERDGFSERKRAKMYEMFCELAAHPTYKGFQMLSPSGNGAHCGPFFEAKTLGATISELARLALQAGGVFTSFFPHKSIAAMKTKLAFMEGSGKWCEMFYSKPFDRTAIHEIKAAIEQLESKDKPAT